MSKDTVSSGIKSYVRTHLHEIEPLLELDEPFNIDDIPWDFAGSSAVLRGMHSQNIIEKVEKDATKGDRKRGYIWTWRVRDAVKEYAQTLIENQTELPCGHRAHIRNKGDHYGCQYCDEDREYTREMITNRL